MTEDFHKQKTLPDLHAGIRPFPLPRTIGPYKIESLLSKGGMSILYLGVHPDTGQPIAIKVLLPKYLRNKEVVNRFLKEAQIIAMTNHPNIIHLYGQGQWEKGLYIAMEFIQGISLRQFIQQKSLTTKRALEIILQVAYALSHLHSHGVIHRDLKPENILITESGAIKVIDFGIAQLEGDSEQERITQKKRMMGTPSYMSPEQKEKSLQVSYTSDIYSLGIVAYELILGRLSHGVIHLALLPRALRTIIEKMLRIDPKERYQDIVECITDFSQYLRTLSDEPVEEEEEFSDEIFQMLQQTRALLTPAKAPTWPQIEIGIALQEGPSFSSLYLDFSHFPDNRYCVLIAEPLVISPISLSHTAIFRGMARIALHRHDHPLKILQALNQALSQDPMQQSFALSFLLLSPEKEQLSFISCKAGPLYHLAEGKKKARLLATPNPALGADPNAVLLETVDNWNPSDTLFIHSAGISFQEEDIAEFALFSPQHQADKLLGKWGSSQKGVVKKPSAMVVLQRV